jgi:hypothetical protein
MARATQCIRCGRDDAASQRQSAPTARGNHRCSIDFGAKGYGNLVELASLQHHVAGELGLPAGRLLMIVKSAHVYETELAYVLGVLIENEGDRSS